MDWQKNYKSKLVSAEKAVSVIKSGDRIGMPGGSSQPINLVNALCKRKDELRDVTLTSGISMYPYELFKAEFKGHINFISLFVGPMERAFLRVGNVEPISYHFSLADQVSVSVDPNVYICEVSSPDAHGYMSFGPVGVYNSDICCKRAETVIAQVNKETPRVRGSRAMIHVSQVDYIVENDHPLPVIPEMPISDIERTIASHIAERIPDGATIQCGIGAVSDAVVSLLDGKKDLGVHTEMFTNGLMNLAKKGVITGARKSYHPDKILCGFGIGNKEFYDFIDDNPIFEFLPIYEVNNFVNIIKNDNMVAINNIMTADLTGQCASESIGHAMYSGTGGQLDFTRGANASRGGMSFLATASTAETKEGRISKIVSAFKPGTIITTPRSDVRYIVTEYGVADLWLKSVPKRVREMLRIAHPDFREQLEREAHEAGLLS